jgi:hypothetical protein
VSGELLQQFRVLVEQPEEVEDGGQRGGLAAFVTTEGVVAAAGEARRGDLGQAELAADAAEFRAPWRWRSRSTSASPGAA